MNGYIALESIELKDDIGISKEQWLELLLDNEVIREDDRKLLQLIYQSNNFMATASQITQSMNAKHYSVLNLQVPRMSKRIVKKLHLEPLKRRNDSSRWWHVAFWGTKRKEGFYWILRPELKAALDEFNDLFNHNHKDFILPEEISQNEISGLTEGAKKQVIVNAYERNPDARKKCIKTYGWKCIICGFDFVSVYGEVGKDTIQVHHKKPLSEIGEKYQVDPINDLTPVCPNCHVIIHKKSPPYSIEEVKKLIEKNRKINPF